MRGMMLATANARMRFSHRSVLCVGEGLEALLASAGRLRRGGPGDQISCRLNGSSYSSAPVPIATVFRV